MRYSATLGVLDGTAPSRRPDHGISLVEMVVAIALMGLTVTAIISGLRVSIVASSDDRDHATAFVWLQAASDEIYAGPRVACTRWRGARVHVLDEELLTPSLDDRCVGESTAQRQMSAGRTGTRSSGAWTPA